jgi:hypothetical protein
MLRLVAVLAGAGRPRRAAGRGRWGSFRWADVAAVAAAAASQGLDAANSDGAAEEGQFVAAWSLAYVGTFSQLGPATSCDMAGPPTVDLTMLNLELLPLLRPWFLGALPR